MYLFCALAGSAYAREDGAASRDAEGLSLAVERLGEALHEYQRIADTGGWPTVPPGPTIGPGSLDLRLGALVTRLRATGDLASDNRVFNEYDDELQAAVGHFQARHGLEPDGLVGRATLRALNRPVEERIAQLCTSIERAREVFAEDRPDFLLVNIPAFRAYLVRDDEPVWSTGVIVGKKNDETPLFESQIESVVVNPTWSVPRSIAGEELLPKIQNDPGFLARGAYEVIDGAGDAVDPASIDWAAFDRNSLPFRLVQRPGPQNELGRIKFLLPNPHGVCMHDTPNRYLFDYESRAFSHGCIRLDKPVELAVRLLAEHGWTPARLDAQLASGKTLSIPLPEPLPVVIAYLTASVNDSGKVFFYRDVYGWGHQPASCDPP